MRFTVFLLRRLSKADGNIIDRRDHMIPPYGHVQWRLEQGVTGGTVAAYIASRALEPGASYLEVFRFAGTTAFVAYAGGAWPITIWYHRGVGLALKATFDALLYGAVTAGVFGWLWPN